MNGGVVVVWWINWSWPAAPPAVARTSVQPVEGSRRVPLQTSVSGEMEAAKVGGSMGGKADVEMQENPFEPYIESLRQQLEGQDPVFLIGVIVALAVVVITCGKNPLLAC